MGAALRCFASAEALNAALSQALSAAFAGALADGPYAVMLAGGTVAVPGVLSAQGGDGFLFNQPRATLKFESGYGWQTAAYPKSQLPVHDTLVAMLGSRIQ